MILQELHGARYFDVFEFNASEKHWACFVCNHPEKVFMISNTTFNNILIGDTRMVVANLKKKRRISLNRFRQIPNCIFDKHSLMLSCNCNLG